MALADEMAEQLSMRETDTSSHDVGMVHRGRKPGWHKLSLGKAKVDPARPHVLELTESNDEPPRRENADSRQRVPLRKLLIASSECISLRAGDPKSRAATAKVCGEAQPGEAVEVLEVKGERALISTASGVAGVMMPSLSR